MHLRPFALQPVAHICHLHDNASTNFWLHLAQVRSMGALCLGGAVGAVVVPPPPSSSFGASGPCAGGTTGAVATCLLSIVRHGVLEIIPGIAHKYAKNVV